jgi:predicted O-methyltransferase YrrM
MGNGSAALHFGRYLVGLDRADSQTTQAEREWLAEGKLRAVEIGVYEGVGTRTIASRMNPRGVLYAIDPFLGGRLGICWNEWIARWEMRRVVPVRIEVILAFSHEAVCRIQRDFDLLFVDGDHSDEGIRRDWSDWSPRIRPGGIVALHDTRASPTTQELRRSARSDTSRATSDMTAAFAS